MIQYILWSISFVFLWLSFVWLFVLLERDSSSKSGKHLLRRGPKITIAIPAYNEARTIEKTISSVFAIHYPKEKLEVVVVNDGSTDGTAEKLSFLKSRYPLIVINKKRNEGKVSAFNSALAVASGEYFATLDADCCVSPNILEEQLPLFKGRTAAVIPSVLVDAPKNLYEHLQYVEYVLTNIFRSLMSSLGTLFLTPGIFSLFRADVLRSIGGFSEDSGFTEDLEIALRLHKAGYVISMASDAVTFTKTPDSFWSLWLQRVRWYRGFLFNHKKYRSLVLDKKYGLLGVFQLPVNIVGVFLLLAAVALSLYGLLDGLWQVAVRSITIDGYFAEYVLEMPKLEALVLGRDFQIALPVLIAFFIGSYFFYYAYSGFNSRWWKHFPAFVVFVYLSPVVTSFHWCCAIFKEFRGSLRKW